eukprot:2778187-Pleurochrysis_carterae.AAC.1
MITENNQAEEAAKPVIRITFTHAELARMALADFKKNPTMNIVDLKKTLGTTTGPLIKQSTLLAILSMLLAATLIFCMDTFSPARRKELTVKQCKRKLELMQATAAVAAQVGYHVNLITASGAEVCAQLLLQIRQKAIATAKERASS